MEVYVNYVIEKSNNGYNTISFHGYGKNISTDEYELFLLSNTCLFAYNDEQLQELIKEKISEYEIEVKENVLKNAFIDNIKKYGYPITLAIKEVMEQGFKVGFHYDLMGCATIEKINSKSFTIIDILDRKNYITKEYLQSLMLSQFYITKE